MKILKVDVEWYEGCANDPKFIVHVDKLPETEELEYELYEYNGKHFLVGEKDGFVSYFCHSPDPKHNDGGFGGAVFEVTVKGKGKVRYVGPWSSRAGVVNKILRHRAPPMQVVDVFYYEKEGDYPDLGFAGAITLDTLVKHLPENLSFKRIVDENNEIVYVPCRLE